MIPLLRVAGLVDDSDRAQSVRGGEFPQCAAHPRLEIVPHREVVPMRGGEKLLERANRSAGRQSVGFGSLAWGIGEQSSAVIIQARSRPVLIAECVVRSQVRRKRRPQVGDLLIGHWVSLPIHSSAAIGKEAL